MTPDQEKLLIKVQALLNKANCPGVTETESQAFFAKAMELLTKHGLQTADLEAIKTKIDGKPDYGLKHDKRAMNRDQHESDDYIWPILDAAFGVKTIYSHTWENGKRQFAWLFVGDEMSVLLASVAAGIVYKTMTQNCRRYIKENGLKKSANLKRSYYRGVMDGFLSQLRAAEAAAYAEATKGQQDAYGLMVVGKKEAIEVYAEEELKVVSLKSRHKPENHGGAYNEGVRKGREMDLNVQNKLN